MTAIRKALQTCLALRVAARLDERAAELAPHVTERLRFAREQALRKARFARGRCLPLSNSR